MRFSAMVFALVLAAVVAGGAVMASAQDPAPASDASGEGELWGDKEPDGELRGVAGAKGDPYNVRHIAYAAAVIAVVGIGLILLIRRHTRDEG
jgi:hypothetical protein